MPRGRTRKRRATKAPPPRTQEIGTPVTTARTAATTFAARNPFGRQQRVQNLWMSALVALGCWGFAVSFIFMTNDPNRYLFGVMAALLAVMWSILFVMRLRKWRQRG